MTYTRFFLVLLCVIPSLCIAAGQGFYGIYTNIEAREGEPSGMEMYILNDGRPGRCSDSVLFQVMEGWPRYPELLDCCGCSADRIEFESEEWGKFIGQIEGDTLTGEFVQAGKRVVLKKGKGFWQKPRE